MASKRDLGLRMALMGTQQNSTNMDAKIQTNMLTSA